MTDFHPTSFVIGCGSDVVAEGPASQSGCNDMMALGELAWWPAPGTLLEDAKYTGGLRAGGAWNYSAVWACTRAIAETLATLPGMLYEQVNDRERRPSDDPLAAVLAKPNPWMDGVTFFDLQTCRLVNAGNAFAEKERNEADQVTGLWPIEPSRVRVWQLEDGSIEYHVFQSQHLENPNRLGDPFYVIDPRDMVNIVGPNSYDGLLAPGVIPRAGEDIQHGLATRRYGAAFFGSGGRPSGVLEHPGHLSPDDRNQMRREWNEIHAPAMGGRPHQIAVLWESMKFREISIAPEQAQFLESTKLNAQIIAQWYGVSPAVIQDYSDSKFATVEAQLKHFVMLSLRPWAVRWESGLKHQLLGASSNLFFEFVFSALLRGDTKTQSEASEIKFRNGALSQDEWRAMENMNPIANGLGAGYWINNAFSPVEARAASATADAGASQSMEFAREVLDAAFRREQRNERTAAKRAIAKGAAAFCAWTSEYYVDFENRLTESIRAACVQLGEDAVDLARRYVGQSQHLLKHAVQDELERGNWRPQQALDALERFTERSLL